METLKYLREKNEHMCQGTHAQIMCTSIKTGIWTYAMYANCQTLDIHFYGRFCDISETI